MTERRHFSMPKSRQLFALGALLVLVGQQSCASGQVMGPPSPSAPAPAVTGAATAPTVSPGYILGAGDKVQVTVFGETALTGEFTVSGVGDVSLPLIGNVHASGLTVPQFVESVRTRLADGYIRDPKVSAQMLTFRPYYILGEISKPGEYPYSDDLTVMNAIATAGGFTYRAEKKRIFVRHPGASREVPVVLTATTPVQPGDTIRIRERFF